MSIIITKDYLKMIKQDTQLYKIIQPVVQGLGYELWGTEFSQQGKGFLLRIYIDSEHGINIDDCEKVSHQLSNSLDVEDIIPERYTLEVSSPGMDRPLFTAKQYTQNIGHQVMIRLSTKIDGRRKFTGKLASIDNSNVIIIDNEQQYTLPIATIEKANIIPQF